MGKTKKNIKHFRIRVLVFSVLVCAWLFPTNVGIAASASSNMKVTLTVEDSIGVIYGRDALNSDGNQAGQVITEFVTRTGSSQLIGDAISGSDNDKNDSGESRVVVTVSNL